MGGRRLVDPFPLCLCLAQFWSSRILVDCRCPRFHLCQRLLSSLSSWYLPSSSSCCCSVEDFLFQACLGSFCSEEQSLPYRFWIFLANSLFSYLMTSTFLSFLNFFLIFQFVLQLNQFLHCGVDFLFLFAREFFIVVPTWWSQIWCVSNGGRALTWLIMLIFSRPWIIFIYV